MKDDNSRNSLDWQGIYTGLSTGSCEGCDPMQVVLKLFDNTRYLLERTEKGKVTQKVSGNFEWNIQGGEITLKDADDTGIPLTYKVEENQLTAVIEKDKLKQQSFFLLKKTLSPLMEKYWKLIELNSQPVITPQDAREVFIVFSAFDNRFHGFAGCNNISGAYEIEKTEKIKLSRVISTNMACVSMEKETLLNQVLLKVDSYKINGDTLSLYKARMAPLARFTVRHLR